MIRWSDGSRPTQVFHDESDLPCRKPLTRFPVPLLRKGSRQRLTAADPWHQAVDRRVRRGRREISERQIFFGIRPNFKIVHSVLLLTELSHVGKLREVREVREKLRDKCSTSYGKRLLSLHFPNDRREWSLPFYGTFSRHDRIKASFILLIWLNENVL